MIEQTLNPTAELSPEGTYSGDTLGLYVEIHPGLPTVAEISGEIDIASASWLRETLLLAIQRHGPVLRVDLREVTLLDCSGVNAMLATARRAGLEGGRMRVIRPSAPVSRVIALLGLTNVLTRDDVQAVPMTLPWCKDHRPFDPGAPRRTNCRTNN